MASLSDVLLREGAFALSRPSCVHQVLHFARLRVQFVDVLLRVVLEPNADDYPLALVLDRLTGQIRLDDDDVLSRHFIRSLFVLERAGTFPWTQPKAITLRLSRASNSFLGRPAQDRVRSDRDRGRTTRARFRSRRRRRRTRPPLGPPRPAGCTLLLSQGRHP